MAEAGKRRVRVVRELRGKRREGERRSDRAGKTWGYCRRADGVRREGGRGGGGRERQRRGERSVAGNAGTSSECATEKKRKERKSHTATFLILDITDKKLPNTLPTCSAAERRLFLASSPNRPGATLAPLV